MLAILVGCNNDAGNIAPDKTTETTKNLENEIAKVTLSIPNISNITVDEVSTSNIVSSGFNTEKYEIIITEVSKSNNFVVSYKLKVKDGVEFSKTLQKTFEGFKVVIHDQTQTNLDNAVDNLSLSYLNEATITVINAKAQNVNASNYDTTLYKFGIENFVIGKDSVSFNYKLALLDDSKVSKTKTKTFSNFVPLSRQGVWENLSVDAFPIVIQLLALDYSVYPSENETKIKNINNDKVALTVTIKSYDDETGVMALNLNGSLYGYNLQNQVINVNGFSKKELYRTMSSFEFDFSELIDKKITLDNISAQSNDAMLTYFNPISIATETNKNLHTQNNTEKYQFVFEVVSVNKINNKANVAVTVKTNNTFKFADGVKTANNFELFQRTQYSLSFYTETDTLNYLTKYVTLNADDYSASVASFYLAEFNFNANNIATAFASLGATAIDYFGDEIVYINTYSVNADDINGNLHVNYILKHKETESQPYTFTVNGFKKIDKALLASKFSALSGTKYNVAETGSAEKAKVFKQFIASYNNSVTLDPTLASDYVNITNLSTTLYSSVFESYFILLNHDTQTFYSDMANINKKGQILYENQPIESMMNTSNHTFGSDHILFKGISVERGNVSIYKIADNDYTAKVELKISIQLFNSGDYASDASQQIEIVVPFFVTKITYTA